MARNIAPETPITIGTPTVKVPDIDLSVFDKLGDAKIKSATQNFQLYATTTLNAESQKLFNQYSANPVALANALSKLPEMFSDLPQSVQDEMKQKLVTNAISLVSKAQANQEKAIIRQNKLMAHDNAVLLEKQLTDDVFNRLRNITVPDSEKRQVDDDAYYLHRAELSGLTRLTDEDGNPLFSDAQRTRMLMPKDAFLNGFREFIYRADEKQLKDWDSNIFQNRNKFMEDLGIDADSYDSAEKILTQRLKQLKNDDVRKIKTQAMIDTADLLKDASNEAKIQALRDNPNIPNRLIDKTVKINKQIIESNWYNPKQSTDPTGLLESLVGLSEIVNNKNTDPDTMEKKIEIGLGIVENAIKNGAKYNMSSDDIADIASTVSDSIVDDGFAQNIQMLDIPFLKNVVEAHRADIIKNPGLYAKNELKTFDETQEAFHKEGRLSPFEKKASEAILGDFGSAMDIKTAHNAALDYAKRAVVEIKDYLRATGDREGAKQMVNSMKYNYIKLYNSNWIPDSEFDRMQMEFEAGKKPVYFYNNVAWEYQGYQNNGSIFKTKL